MSNLVFNLAIRRWHLQFENCGFRPRLTRNGAAVDPPLCGLLEFRPWDWRPFPSGWLRR